MYYRASTITIFDKNPSVVHNTLLEGFIMNMLICDDDTNITKQVVSLINKFEKSNKLKFNIKIFNNGDEVLKEDYYSDFAIIDVEMPGISGIKLSEKLKKANPDIIIIILTSFTNYLDAAMKIKVFRYLSKPIDKMRFFNNLTEAIIEYKRISKTVIVESNDEIHILKTKDILFIENLKYGSKLVTKRGDYITKQKPKEWYTVIDQPICFAYSHNSIIVNLQNVIDFNKTTVILRKSENETVTTYISQRKYSSFKKSFFKYAGGLK